MLGSDHPDIADTYADLAEVYLSTEDDARAMELLTSARQVFEKTYSPPHMRTANTYKLLALVHERKGETVVGRQMAALAMRTYEESVGAQHQHTVKAKQKLQHLLER